MNPPRLIAILGAESTGKTSLAQSLAEAFQSPWVPEFLRTFCESKQRTPLHEEQARILETQLIHEHAAQVEATRIGAPFVFCDATPLTTAIYSDFVFGDKSLYARARALHHRYTFSLLLANDLLWVADGFMRDGAQVRDQIYEMLERELNHIIAPYSVVKGDGHARTLVAMQAIKALPSRAPSH